MRIKEVEELVGIAKKNIRFYEQEGLLSPGREKENSYRSYSQEDIMRLRQIKLLRKLGIPLCEIRELLEGGTTLSAVAEKHLKELEKQKTDTEKSILITREILSEGRTLENLDAESTLLRLELLEKDGTRFVNITKTDVRKKRMAPIAVCCLIVAILMALAIVFIVAILREGAPAFLWLFVILLVFNATGAIFALEKRLKEIQGGEENDLSNY